MSAHRARSLFLAVAALLLSGVAARARNPEYNNSQVRAAIEPKFTTTRVDQAKKMVAGWHELDFERMKATAIAIPGQEGRTCPPMT